MRISFVIPFIDFSGGIAVVLEHARQLRRLGHHVDVVYPLVPYRLYYDHFAPRVRWHVRLRQVIRNTRAYTRQMPWSAEPAPIVPIPTIVGPFVPDADAVIATAWPTAYSVARLPPRKGAKFYFI